MSPYLRKTIMTALAAVALTAVNAPASAAHICSDNSCWFVPDPVDPPEPIYTPPVIDDPYPGDQGGDNGGDGGGGDPAPTPDFVACSNLVNTKPHGCSRELAAAGLQRPTSLLPPSLATLADEEFPASSNLFHILLDTAVDDLNKCYADVSGEPEMCEIQFIARLGNGGTIQRMGTMLDPWSFSVGTGDTLSLIVVARLARTGASWVGILSPSAGIGSISINFGVVGEFLASLNGFNDALYKARLQKSCTFWVGAWDQAHCQ